ncbi:MAG: T9SS type A sorting domain-containing protein [Bacteroidetes bacterium]|nr:T9SS type A sorting domain-containing protein [Bacteroidota bacterium]
MRQDTGLPLTLRIRNETLGGIVTDSIRYPNGYHDEFRYTARQMAFGILKKNAALIVMDDDSDTSFVSFYNETLTSNMNKIDSLETLLSNKLFVEADTLLNHFTDTNTIEHNYKRVYRLYIKLQLYGDTSLTNSDWDELYAIAMLHPLTGGHAVFAARNILKLEVHDGKLSSARLMQPRKETTSKTLLIYPNPANQFVILKYTGNESISRVIILDITGREVLQVNNTDIIDTSVLTDGLYFVKANVEGKWFNGSFIISR